MKFQTSCVKHVLEDSKTLAQLIQTIAQSNQLIKGKQLHAKILTSGYQLCMFVSNHLLNMYSKCGEVDYAIHIFDKMPQRNLISWTAMITGFSQNLMLPKAAETFHHMRKIGENPTQFAFSSILRACTSLGSIEFGKQMHSLALKHGFGYELFVGSNLADMYSKCGLILNACKVFDEMESKDEVVWTSMIDGYTKSGDFERAMLTYKRMVKDDMITDEHVLCSTLDACGTLKALNAGKCLHSLAVKLGFDFDISVGNGLTNMYSKVGDMVSALNVFGFDSKDMNIVSCTSLIDGYVEMGQIDKALNIFIELRRQGVEPNEFTFSSLIKACASQAALEHGRQFHAQLLKFNLNTDLFVSSVLVDMYGKCGLLEDSVQMFDQIKYPTEFAWNSLINVFAQHGMGRKAIEIFDKMNNRGVKPNAITFVSLLTGCSHIGLVEEGLNYFYSMEKTYGVVPRAEHYSCVIDLLSRAGRLIEAEEFMNKMPFEPNAFGWCSFLGACRSHGDKERGKLAAEKLMQLEPENSGAHVLLSNIYAKEQQWEDVRALRKMMRDGNVKKLPGYSWVDIGNKTHIFGAEDSFHFQKKEIYEKLDTLLEQIKKVGYVPKTENIPLDIDDFSKEMMLHRHSERIAVAFALINTPTGKPIIVKKNLRVCIDCHSALKYISKVTQRLIIVRDIRRFHHFSNGLCSCGDFW